MIRATRISNQPSINYVRFLLVLAGAISDAEGEQGFHDETRRACADLANVRPEDSVSEDGAIDTARN
jgi:hypothetical protein